ncbi:MAG: hypothetical protein J6P79_07530 [Pseudobutyrivibrio sp.]|nr:hypothetical protein [Pseudobutyrivibrio sp.]
MKHRRLVIIAAALAMIGAASVGPAMAYFTDTHIATGMVSVNLADSKLTPHESVEDMIKTIEIENTGNYDVYVRAKAIFGSTVSAEIADGSSEKWSKAEGDDYYVYSDVLKPNEKTEALKLRIIPPDDTTQDSFNVVIVEEATKALYKTDGTYEAPDWSLAINNVEGE